MQVGVLGISHKSADLSLRDTLARACSRCFSPEDSKHRELSVVLLSTCNRSELYFSAENLTEAHGYLLRVLRDQIEGPFEHRLYSYFGADCFTHLARVTSGLDSAIVAETEIQGQVKLAYEKAKVHQKLPHSLHFLFQKCLKLGKDIRSSFSLNLKAPALGETVFQTVEHFFSQLENCRILFVGASKINHEIIQAFQQQGITDLALCNRSYARAHAFAEKEQMTVIPWEDLDSWKDFDCVIFGTSSPKYLLSMQETQARELLNFRKLLIDLSVPRNVDPQLGKVRGITLLNIDQIDRLVEKKRNLQERSLPQAQEYLKTVTKRQLNIFEEKESKRYELLLGVGA